eukprot:gene34224-44211_t
MLKDIGAEEEIRSSVEIFKQTLFKMVATSEGTLSIVTEARIQQMGKKYLFSRKTINGFVMKSSSFRDGVSMQAFESGDAPPLESNGLFNM